MEKLLGHVAAALAQRVRVTVVAWRCDNGEWSRANEAGLAAAPSFEPFQLGLARVVQLRLTGLERAALSPLTTHLLPGLGRFAYGRSRVAAAALYARVVGPAIARVAADADVIHSWGPDLMSAACRSAARHTNARFVITPFSHPGQWGDDPATVRIVRSADAVLALSSTDAGVYGSIGAALDRVHVVGACVPEPKPLDTSAIRRSLGDAGQLVLFLGARRPYKGWDLLLAAAPLIRKRHPHATVAFVGPGEPLADHDGVRDFGVVDDDVRATFLRAADVLCLPSDHEILPIAVLEAWAAGTPAVVSEIPTLAELARLGGALTAPRTPDGVADAVARLLLDRDLRAKLGEEGRRVWADRFSVEAVVTAHLDAYEAAAR